MGRYVVEYSGIDFNKYYGGCNNYRGSVKKYFDNKYEAMEFALTRGQDDCGIGNGKNRHFNEDKRDVHIYEELF